MLIAQVTNSPAAHHARPHRKAAWLCLLLFSLVLVASCASDSGEDAAAADSSAVQAEIAASDSTAAEHEGQAEASEKAIKVDVAEVRRGELVMPIYADGAIRTPLSVQIRTKAAGELVAVRIRDGDRVKKGQLLAQIDQREYSLALQESRYRHFQALSQMAAEADTFEINHVALNGFIERRRDLERLLQRGTLSHQEFEAQLLELEMSALQEGAFRQDVFQQRTGLAEARVAEERAKLNLENTEIRAPFSGVVQGLAVVPGEIIGTGAPICSIYNNDELEANLNVLEADLGNLVVGRPALLAIPATGDTLQARVDVISPRLDETSRTCEVLIRFANPEGKFRPGMFVRAEIAGWIYRDKLAVPKAAVLMRDNRPLVFKVNDDRAQWLYVTTGLENDLWVEIMEVHSGGSLAPGDRVVVSDHLTLAHEARISIRRTSPPSQRWAFAAAHAESAP